MEKTELPKIEWWSVKDIQKNPENPRLIRNDKFKKLLTSINSFPQMLLIRPIVVDEDNVIIGGNMRFRACVDLKWKFVPVIRANDLTEQQKYEFVIKDNTSSGEWNHETLANEWDGKLLDEWGHDKVKFDAGIEEKPKEKKNPDTFYLKVEFDSEEDCHDLYKRLTDEGFICDIT